MLQAVSTVCIAHAEGCPRAEVDTAQLFGYFDANGWSISSTLETADLVVVSACAFDANSESRGFGMLEAADRKRRAGSQMVVVGCIAGISRERLEQTFDAIVIPPSDMSRLDEVIAGTVSIRDTPDPNDIRPRIERASACFSYADRPVGDAAKLLARSVLARTGLRNWMAKHGRIISDTYAPPDRNLYSVRVARGCLNECAYCAIRIASGPLISKPLDKVLDEFDAGLDTGHKTFSLLAQDLGAYGQDEGTDVACLLRHVFERDGDYKIKMDDFNVRWLVRYADELIPLLANNAARVDHLSIPTQSGSDRVLGLMRRGNTSGEAKAALSRLRESAPGIDISTHVLMGFPGEANEDFEQTLDMLRVARFDRIDAFGYSDRPGTAASSMPDHVEPSQIASRLRRVRSAFPGVVCVTK